MRPWSPNPDFPATGDLVNIPNVRMPVKGRGEYRLPLRIDDRVRADLAEFAPNVVHLSSPDPAAHGAEMGAREGYPGAGVGPYAVRNLPALLQPRFPRTAGRGMLRRFYQRCDALVAPSQSQIAELTAQAMHDDISIWSRGVDRTVFDPSKRDHAVAPRAWPGR